MGSLNVSRIFDDAAGKLGERLAKFSDSLGLHLEAALLRHCGVPAER